MIFVLESNNAFSLMVDEINPTKSSPCCAGLSKHRELLTYHTLSLQIQANSSVQLNKNALITYIH